MTRSIGEKMIVPLWVSDKPMGPEGVKTAFSDTRFTDEKNKARFDSLRGCGSPAPRSRY